MKTKRFFKPIKKKKRWEHLGRAVRLQKSLQVDGTYTGQITVRHHGGGVKRVTKDYLGVTRETKI